MRNIKSTSIAHHNKKRTFTHGTLYICTHVFVRVDQVKGSLESLYEGPYPVSERITDHIIKVLVLMENLSVSQWSDLNRHS